MIVDKLLHTLIPVLVIIYWILYGQHSGLIWKRIPGFLVYPMLYLMFILLRGEFPGFYSYPFVNVSELGWPQTLINIVILFGLFLVLFLLFTETVN